MKKLMVLLVVMVLSIIQLKAEVFSSDKIEKLVYPGLVYGTTILPATCFNISPSMSEAVRFAENNDFIFVKAASPVDSRLKSFIQLLKRRSKLLDHLLA
jgi:hypothetical protein